MKLNLTYYGDPILRKKSLPVEEINQEIRQLVADMIETVEKLPNAVGLSAPQVNHSLAIFVIQFPKSDEKDRWIPGPIEVFINPKILDLSHEKWSYSEGCLSIPGLYEDVPRPVKIKIQAQNLDGELFTREYSGYPAKMFLHENDHLNGVLFIDRIDKNRRNAIENALRRIKKEHAKN